ncbi:immunity 50 family protein [Pendulispora brunnea]|uniref:Immunity 50 family protein n=1 Tax=Pendulispora brunnea TaxID=2905690 RepID=A0ABZ2KAW8_9BACT
MDWIDSIGQSEFLRKLFPAAPILRGVRLHELTFHQDGPRVLIRFDLNDFPCEPPSKWIQARANRVQVRLLAVGVRELELRGWSSNNIVDFDFSPHSKGILLTAQGRELYMRAAVDHLTADGISAYQDIGVSNL